MRQKSFLLWYKNRSSRDAIISFLGGFYHETTVAYFPSSETWMSQYVVSYSDDNINYQFYRNQHNSIEVWSIFTSHNHKACQFLHTTNTLQEENSVLAGL